MHSPESSLASEQHLKISPRQSSTASARKRGSSSQRPLLSRTSWTDCSPASELSPSHPRYPMHSPESSPVSERSPSLPRYPTHSPGSSLASEQHLKISPRQSSTASARKRGSSFRMLLLSQTSWTDCSQASERSPSHPRYPMHSPESSPGSDRWPSLPRYPTLSRGSSLASEQHLKISPRQSSTASASPRGSSYRRLLLSRTSLTDCSLASGR